VLPGTERHPHARAVLAAAVREPSHAYLFHGPAGAGKRAVARAFAAELLADGAPDPDNVRTRVDHGVHPDLTWIVPSGAAEMLVDDIREPVIAAAARTPFEARRRVFVIERADVMNDEAANRMLKTLEEPPPFAHLVLLTDRPSDVLPTVRSRCQPVRFDAATADQIASLLQAGGAAPDQAQACARLALGDAERARALVTGDGPALRAAAEAFARAPLAGRLHERPWLALLGHVRRAADTAQARVEEQAAADAELLPKKERKRAETEAAKAAKRAGRRAGNGALDLGLSLAGLWYRDVACVLDGADDLVHATDRLGQLREDAEGRDVHALRAAIEATDETRVALKVYVNEELALEALAARLARTLS
jgi:DNA polymerase III subunit delta'